MLTHITSLSVHTIPYHLLLVQFAYMPYDVHSITPPTPRTHPHITLAELLITPPTPFHHSFSKHLRSCHLQEAETLLLNTPSPPSHTTSHLSLSPHQTPSHHKLPPCSLYATCKRLRRCCLTHPPIQYHPLIPPTQYRHTSLLLITNAFPCKQRLLTGHLQEAETLLLKTLPHSLSPQTPSLINYTFSQATCRRRRRCCSTLPRQITTPSHHTLVHHPFTQATCRRPRRCCWTLCRSTRRSWEDSRRR